MKKISPSILSSDFSCLGKEIKALEEAGADYIHIDVMDGHFVPNITVGPLIVESAGKATNLPLDVHLMIENPDFYISDFAKAGSTILTVHPEACKHLQKTLKIIKEYGVQPAVALNPATPLCFLDHILDDVEMILIMTVNPGFGGQTFISAMIPKIKELRSLLDSAGKKIPIEVDGGIVVENIRAAADAGADIFVSGSGVLKTGDYKKTISKMKELINS
jgi:ribulose-phosphate 3-epimerase